MVEKKIRYVMDKKSLILADENNDDRFDHDWLYGMNLL